MFVFLLVYYGLGGLVSRPRLTNKGLPFSKSDSTKDPQYMWAWCTLNLTPFRTLSLEKGCQLRCRRHLTAVQNYEVHPKTTLGRGGRVARSRLWGRRVPGSKPDSTEDPPCMGPVAR
ncbi:hypothetical protein AVEN_233827-1 [Araneus ventricosus]|uniref:Secreted protein n=1 Tax=Araneus ventricosus TaxID=182803 RepID=A0A4Y2H3T4_ARAVE|nr:hypothetical protein AVEN_233827-1 [Araneus ventricosus]